MEMNFPGFSGFKVANLVSPREFLSTWNGDSFVDIVECDSPIGYFGVDSLEESL